MRQTRSRWWVTLVVGGLLGCGLSACGETRLTQDTFRVLPTDDPGCIEFQPRRLEMVARAGSEDAQWVRVTSVCDALLEVRSVALEDEAGTFEVASPTDSLLEQGAEAVIEVTFSPLAPGRYTNRLFIRSNDADLPEATVTLTGVAE